MNWQKWLPLIYLSAVVGVLAIAGFARDGRRVPVDYPLTLPSDYRDQFDRALTVDRPDGIVRVIYISPHATEALEAGETLPAGTQIVIEAYQAQRSLNGDFARDSEGRLIRGGMVEPIHMMEKRPDWAIEDLPTGGRASQWNFGSFDVRSQQPTTENRNDCFTCHDSSAISRDMVFTRYLLTQFSQSQDQQYVWCPLTGRANCHRAP